MTSISLRLLGVDMASPLVDSPSESQGTNHRQQSQESQRTSSSLAAVPSRKSSHQSRVQVRGCSGEEGLHVNCTPPRSHVSGPSRKLKEDGSEDAAFPRRTKAANEGRPPQEAASDDLSS